MIAWIKVAIVLDDGIASACFRKYTCPRLHSAPACKSRIEMTYKISSDIIPYPMIEYLTEELSECHRTH